jgi:hypothetical protein
MIAAYSDDCGFVGERDPKPDHVGEADQAMRDLLSTITELADLTDRHRGDSGADVALIEGWSERAEKLCEDIRVALGVPRVLRNGALVPVGSVAR